MPQHKLETLKSMSQDFKFHDKYKVPRKILLLKQLRAKIGLPEDFFDCNVKDVGMGEAYTPCAIDDAIGEVSAIKGNFRGIDAKKLLKVGNCVQHVVKLSKTIFRQSWGKTRIDIVRGGTRFQFYSPTSEAFSSFEELIGSNTFSGKLLKDWTCCSQQKQEGPLFVEDVQRQCFVELLEMKY